MGRISMWWLLLALCSSMLACTVEEQDEPKGSQCGGVPLEGECVSASEWRRCGLPSCSNPAQLVSKSCADHQECAILAGEAACVAKSGRCDPGVSLCDASGVAKLCDDQGFLVETACNGCQQSAIGITCDAGATTVYSGRVRYQARGANQQLTDWTASPDVRDAGGVLVVTMQGQVMLDSARADSEGRFAIKVPTTSGPDLEIRFVAAGPTSALGPPEYALVEPKVADGEFDMSGVVMPTAGARWWSWSLSPDGVDPSGFEYVISEEQGSGAMHVFQQVRKAHETTAALTGESGRPLLVWFRYNTSWSCGACFAPWPITVKSQLFRSQIWLPATAQDESYWADAVTVHELGHWAMSSYGTSPKEGGPHCLGVPTLPGQAWGEGFATGFSTLMRADPIYADKQQGTFFWLDVSSRQYSFGTPWQRARPGDGLLQRMDENEVSAMMWALAEHPAGATEHLTANAHYLDGLRSPRLNQFPFGRGYERNRWDVGSGCQQINIEPLGASAPVFADFLDALTCQGLSAADINAVTEPGLHYPFPSEAPICQ